MPKPSPRERMLRRLAKSVFQNYYRKWDLHQKQGHPGIAFPMSDDLQEQLEFIKKEISRNRARRAQRGFTPFPPGQIKLQ